MISIGLNLILGVMLFCALVLGLRLERRLRGLRDSHQDFAKAVSELDQAAVRTEDSLAKLRRGSEEARVDLAARVDQARLASQRLEKLIADAEDTLNKPLPLRHAEPAPSPVAALVEQVRAARIAAEPVTLRPVAAAQPQAAPARPAPSPRSRALVDDDLFEIGGSPPERRPMFAVMGGRR